MTLSNKEKQKNILNFLIKKFNETPDNDFDDETIAKECNLDLTDAKGLCIVMAQEGLIDHTLSAGKFRFYKINNVGKKKLENTSESNIQAYDLLKNLEQTIRKLIEVELSKTNDRWWRELVPGDVKQNAESRKNKDESRKNWKYDSQPLINYIDFTDYAKIIIQKNNWKEVFKFIFHDKDKINLKLKEIEPIRNAISHTRDLDDTEKRQLEFYSEELLRTISYFYDNENVISKQKLLAKKQVSLPQISVSFDRIVYPLYSKVYLRANMPDAILGEPILFQVFNSQEKLLVEKKIYPETYDDVELKSSGLYQTYFVMKGDEWRIGEEYKVVAKHSTTEAVDFTRIDARKPVLQSDKSVYKWGSDMILTIIDPDGDKDSQLAEFVGDTGNSRLIIQSSKGTIQNYRLKETGNSTGIFQGILGFIGVNDDETTERYDLEGRNVTQTQGFEYDDGFLEVSKDEKIKISYSNDVETAELVIRVVKDYSHLS